MYVLTIFGMWRWSHEEQQAIQNRQNKTTLKLEQEKFDKTDRVDRQHAVWSGKLMYEEE